MTPRKWFWIPLRITTLGYARVEATTAEEAAESVTSGDFNLDEIINNEVESFEITGAPMQQEVG